MYWDSFTEDSAIRAAMSAEREVTSAGWPCNRLQLFCTLAEKGNSTASTSQRVQVPTLGWQVLCVIWVTCIDCIAKFTFFLEFCLSELKCGWICANLHTKNRYDPQPSPSRRCLQRWPPWQDSWTQLLHARKKTLQAVAKPMAKWL